MLAEVHGFIAEHQLIRHGEKILLAISGGIDSMVMAHLFLHLPYETGIAHCNFSLRDEESDQDEELVRKFAEDNKIPFFTARFNTKAFAVEKGISVQMAARELRYAWFEEIRSKNNFDLVAVAHNLNDNVETMLINLARGTGLAGLSGMKPVTGRIIRPLLKVTREKIAKYCSEHAIGYREDRSNAETKYTRNKIRHNVLPLLQQINPSLLTTLSESITRFGELNEIVNTYVSGLRSQVSAIKDGSTVFDLDELRRNSENRTVLFELFRPYNLEGNQIDDLLNIINGRTGSQVITSTHRITRNRDEILVTEKRGNDETCIRVNNLDDLPASISGEFLSVDNSFRIPADASVAFLDSEKVLFPLVIRKWHAGDSFFPLGMNGKKKLSDYFIDKKYSLPEKDRKLVLESDGKIVWIIGDRIDDRFKITSHTTKALILKLLPR
ncbi:MAG TPA: tRNA lysidine(34) synthetase TilS [Bacteroidales bacterium]|nr:tRNA lysidine(34) synthetase TilS [Bacteroidales bacterium]